MLINGQNRSDVSVFDRGFQYGDGLFETIAVIDGRAPLWPRHLKRLQEGCLRLGLELPDGAVLEQEIAAVVENSGPQVVKVIVTRSNHGNGYFPASGKSTRIVYTRPWHRWSDEDYSSGVEIHLCENRLATGSPVAGLKHLNRLEQVIAADEIAKAGLSEGILCDGDGNVVEGLMSNIFWINGEVLSTPLVDRCGVAGVMRAEVMEVARKQGFVVKEVREKPDLLINADGIFLTNAVAGILPVRRVGGNHFDVAAVPYILRSEIYNKMQNGG